MTIVASVLKNGISGLKMSRNSKRSFKRKGRGDAKFAK